MWGILERNESKLNLRGGKNTQCVKRKNSQDLQYRATFCPAQSQDIRRSGKDAWLNHCRRRRKGRFHSTATSQQFCLFLRLLQSSIRFCVQEDCTLLARPLPVLQTGQFLQVITCLQSQTSRRVLTDWIGPWWQCKAKDLKSFWYVFFFLFVSKTKSTAASSIVPYIEYSVIN